MPKKPKKSPLVKALIKQGEILDKYRVLDVIQKGGKTNIIFKKSRPRKSP